MSAWSSLVKAVSKLFSKGGASSTATWTKTWTVNGVKNVQTVTKVAGEAVQAGARTVISWGNAAKVALVGGFSYLFLTGGASNVVSRTLGISEGAAQILIIFGFIVIMILVTRYLINYVRNRFGLKQEYLETPVLKDIGVAVWDEERNRWVRRRD
ncbi:MAG: hypothetical protein SPC89_05590 [Candidatus Methanarcanum hacksteinii]|nr:hypothetical protein [Candidatus Methanarcanum hacksteinii]